MTDVNLSELLRAVIDETDLTDPREIGAKVAEQVPGRQLRSALAEAVSYMARVQFGRDRMHALPQAPGQLPARSAKVAAYQADAEARRRKALHTRVHIGGGEQLLLADCSYEHLMFAAMERRDIAARTLAAAERCQRYAEAVQEHEVDRFGDLPNDVLDALLSDDDEAAA